MTKQQAKRASKLQSHITFHYAIRYEMQRAIFSIFLIAFSSLLMLVGYFYEYHMKELPTIAQFRIRLLIYAFYWLVGVVIVAIVIVVIHYILQFFISLIRKDKDDSAIYLDFAYYKLNKMITKGKITESEMHLFFLNDAMQAYGINPFSEQYIVQKKNKSKSKKKSKREVDYVDDVEYPDEMEYSDEEYEFSNVQQTRNESNNKYEPAKKINRGYGTRSR